MAVGQRVALPWQAWFTLAAQMPLLLVMLWSNLDEPHYQFSILVPLVVLWLARQRALEAKWTPRESVSAVAVSIWVVAWCLFTASVLIMSPWLVAVATLISGLAIAFSIGGTKLLRAVAPLAALWCLIIPLPLGIDESMIQALQAIASNMASLLLDAVGVKHLLHGTVIEIPGTRYLVEEACSGINSLYASTAIVFVVLLLRHSRWYSWLAYGLITVGWVLCMNAIRVFTVVVAGEKWQVDLDTGWRHDAVGAVLFLAILLMLWSSDRMLQFLLPFKERAPQQRSTKTVSGAGVWNWIAFVFLCPALLLAARFTESGANGSTETLASVVVPKSGFQELSDSLAGFQREGELAAIERDMESLEGEHSLQWHFRADAMQATVSLDYSFVSWHYHVNCYPAQGWQITDHRLLQGNANTVTVKMTRGPTEFGWLIYAMFDESGDPITPRMEKGLSEKAQSKIQRLKDRLPTWLGGAQQNDKRTYMLRVFVASGQPISSDSVESATHLFSEVNTLLHSSNNSLNK